MHAVVTVWIGSDNLLMDKNNRAEESPRVSRVKEHSNNAKDKGALSIKGELGGLSGQLS